MNRYFYKIAFKTRLRASKSTNSTDTSHLTPDIVHVFPYTEKWLSQSEFIIRFIIDIIYHCDLRMILLIESDAFSFRTECHYWMSHNPFKTICWILVCYYLYRFWHPVSRLEYVDTHDINFSRPLHLPEIWNICFENYSKWQKDDRIIRIILILDNNKNYCTRGEQCEYWYWNLNLNYYYELIFRIFMFNP
jgi:hypothetical protein